MRRVLISVAGAVAFLWGSQAAAQDAQDQYPTFWSRVTLEIPAYTHHFPHDSQFNDQNWGAFVDVAINPHISFVAGDFKNSYDKNTAFAGVSLQPIGFDMGDAVRVTPGVTLALDLNRGYKDFNDYDPFLGALTLRFNFAPHDQGSFWNRVGLLTTVIPGSGSGSSTAVNVAVTYRFQ